MIIEIACIISMIVFVILLIKERDYRYIIIFIIGLLMGFWIEPYGIYVNSWDYKNIMEPFDYLIFGVPVCIYLLYAFPGASIVFLNKYFIELRKKYKNKIDKISGYLLIAIGIILLILSPLLEVHIFIGEIFIMVGLYLFVKNPVMFYIGIICLVADFIFERLFILNEQFYYTVSYELFPIGFFLGGAIISAIIILMGKHLPFLKLLSDKK